MSILRNLLNHFKWDKQRLLEKFYVTENVEELFQEANIDFTLKDSQQKMDSGTNVDSNQMCDICFDTFQPNEGFKLICEHEFW